MNTYTPGPWRLAPWYDLYGKTSPNKWQGIFEPIPGQSLGSKSRILGWSAKGEIEDAWVSMSEANARLIAAAPDLLEALKVAHIWLETDGRFDMRGINAAIAKAEGRT